MAAENPKKLSTEPYKGVRDFYPDDMAVERYIFDVWSQTAESFGYEAWAGLFSKQWFKLFTMVTFLALYYHAWVGVRNIWMDYIKPAGLRLVLQSATLLYLIACAFYTAQILWSY